MGSSLDEIKSYAILSIDPLQQQTGFIEFVRQIERGILKVDIFLFIFCGHNLIKLSEMNTGN